MKYSVRFSEYALKSLKKLNKTVSASIFAWIKKNLNGTENPRSHGKALKGGLAGLWRYRIGDYRIIADISDTEVVIVVLEVGHRKNIY
jgi:mRNA interferase RelE/StbE